MYYSEDIIEEVRSRSDIVEVISSYVKLQRKGSNYMGLCPFHNEKTPSFSVSPSKQMYYCFGCGAGGNVFSFLMEYENHTFPEAVQILAERSGVALPQPEESQEAKKARNEKSVLLGINKTAAKYYYVMLRSSQGERGMQYLKERRLSQETMKHFGLGYAGQQSDGLYRYLKRQGFSDQILKDSGLMMLNGRQGMYDKFWNRVMFPIMDANSRVIGFGGRVMGDAKPKYLNSPETLLFDKGRNLYGLNFARSTKKKYFLLCEGYMDVISMHQAGFTNAVASLGTALTSSHCTLIKRYVDEVILTYDSDEAGVRAALRAIPLLKTAGVSSRVLHMTPYKDPDEFIKELGPEAFQQRIDEAENSFLFELSVMEKNYDMKDPDGKTRFFQAVAARIAEFELELERENYIEAVVNRYHISFEGMRRLVLNVLMQGVPVRRVPLRTERAKEKKEDGIDQAQRLILTWLCEQPKLFPVISAYLDPEDFSDELYREAARMLYEQLKEGEGNPARIVSHFTEPEDQRTVSRLFHTELAADEPGLLEKALAAAIRRVMEYSIEQKTAALDPTDMAGLQKLIEARRKLQKLPRLHLPPE